MFERSFLMCLHILVRKLLWRVRIFSQLSPNSSRFVLSIIILFFNFFSFPFHLLQMFFILTFTVLFHIIALSIIAFVYYSLSTKYFFSLSSFHYLIHLFHIFLTFLFKNSHSEDSRFTNENFIIIFVSFIFYFIYILVNIVNLKPNLIIFTISTLPCHSLSIYR